VDNANAPIVGTTATCEFSGVRPVAVAISAYHDENDNKKRWGEGQHRFGSF
jgi:hypothetical protein